MGYARSLTVAQDVGGIHHCYSRCTRGERLLDSPDRIAVLERRLAFLSTRVFAIDLIEFKPMGNHVHGIVRTHPELTWCWSDEEVARRWLLLSLAGRRPDLDPGEGPSDTDVAALVARKPRIEELRRRLADLGSYHSAWKEWSAKRWNREDRVSGHFWQGRYGVTTALDDGAVLTQSVYVLLNAVHAGLESELGTQRPGSLKTRIERLVRDATLQAKAQAFEEGFVHASWTPVYPCDPGSAADLDDEEYARRVAVGRHRASFRAAIREEAQALSHFAAVGEREDVERAARELREGDVAPRAATKVTKALQRRPRPAKVPRHRSRSGQAMAPRTEIKSDEQAWMKPWRNPFHTTRLVRGAVPVIPGVTLGMLISLADQEGRHARPDKQGSIARDAEPAVAMLRRMFVRDEGNADQCVAERGPPRPRAASTSDQPGPAPPVRTMDAARSLADELRARIEAIFKSSVRSASSDTKPTALVSLRGTASGSPESLRAEAARRRGTCVHAVRPQRRE